LRFGATLDPHTKGFTLTALLGACGGDLQGLRDAALLSLGYDAELRVSELVAVTVAHIDPHGDGSALLLIPSSKTDQEGQGAWGWLSADTMRRVGAWLVASAITEGPVFRRVGVDRRRLRAAVAPMAYEAIPGHTRHWQEKLRGKKAEPARTVYTVGTASLSRQGVNGIYRRVALSAFDQGLVEMPIGKVEEAARALSSHSLRVGLTQDLFAAEEDGVGIAQALPLVVAVDRAALRPQAGRPEQRRRSRSVADQKLTVECGRPMITIEVITDTADHRGGRHTVAAGSASSMQRS
jgi:hypothetical protein